MIVVRRFLHFLHYLSGEGSWRLSALELLVIDAVTNELSPANASLVRRQLEQPLFIERIPAGRINVIRYYRVDDGLRICETEFADNLFRVRLIVDGRSEQAHVTFYKGHIFSVEFKHPSRFYARKKTVVTAVTAGAPKQSYTREIDKAEHRPTD